MIRAVLLTHVSSCAYCCLIGGMHDTNDQLLLWSSLKCEKGGDNINMICTPFFLSFGDYHQHYSVAIRDMIAMLCLYTAEHPCLYTSFLAGKPEDDSYFNS